MKKNIVIFIIIATLCLSLIGCAKKDNNYSSSTFSKAKNPTNFSVSINDNIFDSNFDNITQQIKKELKTTSENLTITSLYGGELLSIFNSEGKIKDFSIAAYVKTKDDINENYLHIKYGITGVLDNDKISSENTISSVKITKLTNETDSPVNDKDWKWATGNFEKYLKYIDTIDFKNILSENITTNPAGYIMTFNSINSNYFEHPSDNTTYLDCSDTTNITKLTEKPVLAYSNASYFKDYDYFAIIPFNENYLTTKEISSAYYDTKIKNNNIVFLLIKR